jgi:hypothetical protein
VYARVKQQLREAVAPCTFRAPTAPLGRHPAPSCIVYDRSPPLSPASIARHVGPKLLLHDVQGNQCAIPREDAYCADNRPQF